MTVIVGLQHSGHVWLGADSGLSTDGCMAVMARPKVWTRGRVAFGHAGSLRVGNVLECAEVPDWDVEMESYRFVVTVLVPALSDAIEQAGLSFGDDEMLVAVGRHLYCVDSELGTHAYSDGYGAVGDVSATQAALGALHATAGDLPEQRVRAALEAAQAFCTTVRRPWSLVRG